MGIFGPGVGGGFLAAAGAVGGAGKGLADVGAAQQKMNLESKMSELTQKREEAITRLQGQQQSGLEEQRAGHEKERVGEEIAGRSAVAHYETGEKESEAEKQRTFAGGENKAKLASEERRTHETATSRVAAAKLHATASQKPPPPDWKDRTITYGGSIDPVSHLPVGQKQMGVKIHVPTGKMFVPLGDKLMPYDGSKDNGLMFDPKSIKRAPAQYTQDLLNDPNGFTPSGNSKREVFLNKFHYLPGDYLQKAQQYGTPAGGGGDAGEEPETSASQDTQDTQSSVPMTGVNGPAPGTD